MQQVSSSTPLTNVTNQRNEQVGLNSNVPPASKRVIEIAADEDPKYQIKTPAVGNENIPNEAAVVNKEDE